jgi:F-type H+-transporting ATPase subunit delta
MKISKEARRTSRQLFRVCLSEGSLDETRVRAVVAHIAQSKPRGALAILSNLSSLIAAEIKNGCAKVESASPLDEAQKQTLAASLSKQYGRSLNLEYSVNAELLGGMRIQVGSDVWDGSVKARLDQLAAALA